MAKCKPLPPLDQLRERFILDESSPSGLRWPDDHWRVSIRGGRAGCLGPDGYWKLRFGKMRMRVHRVVWALTHNEDPCEYEIDHADGNRSNNDPANLRKATGTQNGANKASRPGSTSRYLGVHLDSTHNRWKAHTRAQGVVHNLGSFRCETAAALAYDKAAERIHGEFANLNFKRVGGAS